MDNIRLILLFSPKESENAMKKRVYTLYRVSTKGQVEKDDIPMQKEACRNFAESQGWEIVKEFSEKGVSGFKKSAKERDELQKIQQAAMEGKFDILLVFITEIRVRKDYEISITLNASFNQVEQLKAVSTYDGAEIFEEISEKGA